jgi:hypothetical protein
MQSVQAGSSNPSCVRKKIQADAALWRNIGPAGKRNWKFGLRSLAQMYGMSKGSRGRAFPVIVLELAEGTGVHPGKN